MSRFPGSDYFQPSRLPPVRSSELATTLNRHPSTGHADISIAAADVNLSEPAVTYAQATHTSDWEDSSANPHLLHVDEEENEETEQEREVCIAVVRDVV